MKAHWSRPSWAILWRSENRLDGLSEHLVLDPRGRLPLLFKTRAEARQHIAGHWGYIRHRPDLRAEPHGWRMPLAVRVTASVEMAR